VLIRVKAAGLDHGQWHLVAGQPHAMRLATGLTKPKQRVLGMDVSGVVEAVGAGVTRFKAGDAVFGAASRTFAEFTCAREDLLCRKPQRLSFEQAAACAISGVTALIGSRDEARLKPGQSVCLIGAGGGVGSWAVQLAKHFGADVTAVCSTSKLEFVRELGAASVIDCTKLPLPTDGRFDVILDLAGNRRLSVLRKALAPRGTLGLGGGEGGGRLFGGMGRTLRALLWSSAASRSSRQQAPCACWCRAKCVASWSCVSQHEAGRGFPGADEAANDAHEAQGGGDDVPATVPTLRGLPEALVGESDWHPRGDES
jgi:NADPH:quinone reductase-like Zn-dependent oxidoreductase